MPRSVTKDSWQASVVAAYSKRDWATLEALYGDAALDETAVRHWVAEIAAAIPGSAAEEHATKPAATPRIHAVQRLLRSLHQARQRGGDEVHELWGRRMFPLVCRGLAKLPRRPDCLCLVTVPVGSDEWIYNRVAASGVIDSTLQALIGDATSCVRLLLMVGDEVGSAFDVKVHLAGYLPRRDAEPHFHRFIPQSWLRVADQMLGTRAGSDASSSDAGKEHES